MMIDLYLRADTAEALATACPWLRGKGIQGKAFWLTSGDGFAFDPIGAVVLEQAVFDDDRNLVEPPVMSGDFRAIMRCTSEVSARVPGALKLDYADAPRKWAGAVEATTVPVPNVISDRQFAEILAMDGLITEDEALAWAGPGIVPAQLLDAVEMIPDNAIRFSAKMHLVGATQFMRDNVFVHMLGMILDRDAVQLDGIWTRAAAL